MSNAPRLHLLSSAMLDWFYAKCSLSPNFIKGVGSSHEFAFLNTSSSYSGKPLLRLTNVYLLIESKGFEALHNQNETPISTRPNRVAARLTFQFMGARPGMKLKHAKCPILVVMATEDDVIPPKVTRRIAASAQGSEYIFSLPCPYLVLLSSYLLLIFFVH